MFEADNTISVKELANLLNQWVRESNRKDPQGITTDPQRHVFAVKGQEMLKMQRMVFGSEVSLWL